APHVVVGGEEPSEAEHEELARHAGLERGDEDQPDPFGHDEAVELGPRLEVIVGHGAGIETLEVGVADRAVALHEYADDETLDFLGPGARGRQFVQALLRRCNGCHRRAILAWLSGSVKNNQRSAEGPRAYSRLRPR